MRSNSTGVKPVTFKSRLICLRMPLILPKRLLYTASVFCGKVGSFSVARFNESKIASSAIRSISSHVLPVMSPWAERAVFKMSCTADPKLLRASGSFDSGSLIKRPYLKKYISGQEKAASSLVGEYSALFRRASAVLGERENRLLPESSASLSASFSLNSLPALSARTSLRIFSSISESFGSVLSAKALFTSSSVFKKYSSCSSSTGIALRPLSFSMAAFSSSFPSGA